MSVALTTVEPSLAELALTANQEHEEALRAGETMVTHAILAGEALNDAREQCVRGDWRVWLAENFQGSRAQASLYRRLAANKDVMLEQNPRSLREANHLLSVAGHGYAAGPVTTNKRRREISALLAQGKTVRDIAEMYEVHTTTVYGWKRTDQQRKNLSRKSNNQQREAKRALQRQARDRAAKKAGGDVAASYTAVRQLAQALDSSITAETNKSAKQALSSALHHAYHCEDRIMEALSVTQPDERLKLFGAHKALPRRAA